MPPKKYKTDEERKKAKAEQQKANIKRKLQNETKEQKQQRLEKDRMRYRAKKAKLSKTCNGKLSIKQMAQQLNETTIKEHSCGNMTVICTHCNSINFELEKTGSNVTRCCNNGKVVVDIAQPNYPKLFTEIFNGRHAESKQFKDNIRSLNNSFAFASMGANVKFPHGNGPYCFRIQGQIYHLAGNLHPDENQKRKYSQLYILDQREASIERMNNTRIISLELMFDIGKSIRQVSPFAQAFKMLHEVEKEVTQKYESEGKPVPEIVMAITQNKNLDKRRYNMATANEVAIIFENADGEPPEARDLLIHLRTGSTGNKTKRINILHPKLDPLIYPFFFPEGKDGWNTNLKTTDNNRITMMMFYKYMFSVRNQRTNSNNEQVENIHPIFHGGRLFQQYIVDAYVRMEGNRINFIKFNQPKFRNENFKNLKNFVESDGNGHVPGKETILPSSFEGSPKNMKQRYQDAMAIVTKFGKPDLFVTMTCNPNWAEIKENLNGEDPSGRPDIVTRVFNMKLKSLLKDIKERQLFGRVIAMVHVIEFQKRGLPHAHILLILETESKLNTEDQVDLTVCAEIPDKTEFPRLYDIVLKQMIHGPCGSQNQNCVCMDNDKCTKSFPKTLRERTSLEVDGYPQYRRRKIDPIIVQKGKNIYNIDNSWVVPYNKYLLLKYNCHINVEVCASVKSVKYLYKYIYKGHDCANVSLNAIEDNDEIRKFVDARYVSPPEAAWRIFGFDMHSQSHSIERLPVHLEDEQPVYFDADDPTVALEKAENKLTKLTDYFRLNEEDPDARELYYREIPEHYRWLRCKVFVTNEPRTIHMWKRREYNIKIIGRMFAVPIKQKELYFLRILLLHVKGATSYEDLRTYENRIYDTFVEAAQARGLLLDDKMWEDTLIDAIAVQMPLQIRELFAYICVFGAINVLDFWNKTDEEGNKYILNAMKEDICMKIHKKNGECINCDQYVLRDIQEVLNCHGSDVNVYGLPPLKSDLLCIEEIFNINNELNCAVSMKDKLNSEQLYAFETIMTAIDNHDVKAKCFFVDGPGGSGKTFLYLTLMHFMRGGENVVFPSASTGIAANLLPGGRTFHSLFGVPVPVTETSVSRITPSSKAAEVLRNCKLFIIDECTMASSHALNTIDRFLREVMNVDVPFGGKVIVLGGDFRQCLTIIPHAQRAAIVQGCITFSKSWYDFERLPLTINMRAEGDGNYCEWLMRLGDGKLTNEYDLGEDVIEIPYNLLCTGCIVTDTFGKEIYLENINEMSRRAILCPKNIDVDKLNEKIIERIPGQYRTYYSTDCVVTDDDEERNNFPIEYLNTVTPSGMPSHILKLKIGAVVMLLRNLNTKKGMCNGTRLRIDELRNHIIVATVLTGSAEGNICLIPRIDLSPTETGLPFQLKRRQFPIKPAFAMTINKSQGQTLDKVGIYLPEPVFGHGQLYVAFSRVRRAEDVKIQIVDGPHQGYLVENCNKVFTTNVVFKEVFEH